MPVSPPVPLLVCLRLIGSGRLSLRHKHTTTGSRSRRWLTAAFSRLARCQNRRVLLGTARNARPEPPNRIREHSTVPPPTSRCSKKGKSRSRINQACQRRREEQAACQQHGPQLERSCTLYAVIYNLTQRAATPQQLHTGGALWLPGDWDSMHYNDIILKPSIVLLW